ncbi:MAG TPA: hypothetical protein VGC27_02730 [Rhizomicrobium sp.]
MKAKVQVSAAGRKGSWRSLVAFLVLVAFSLQGFLIQTHIHELPASAPVTGVSVSVPLGGKTLPDTDTCLFCQEYVHAGAYLTSAAAAMLPPFAVVSLLAIFDAPLVAAPPLSHNWMGRAPPRA